MLLRDNVYGSLEDDAIRRDFTVNALYYCSSEVRPCSTTPGAWKTWSAARFA